MAEETKKKTTSEEKSKSGNKKSTMESLKEGLSDMVDTASLHLQLRKLEDARRTMYTQLGQITYKRMHPTHGTVDSELAAQAEQLVARITDTSQQITDLSIRIKMKKFEK